MSKENWLRALPGIDSLLRSESMQHLRSGYSERALTDALRNILQDLRQQLLSDELALDLENFLLTLDIEKKDCSQSEAWADFLRPRIKSELSLNEGFSFRPVINATGVILHTNLGRAPLGDLAARHVYESLISYSNLEYDLAAGERGERYQALEPLLARLTGQEAALVVNNNAAAVLLILNELAEGKEVIVSRSELVEIGGAFRVPDVMLKANCRLREVGTTNKTHDYDYERAINPETALILKVHQSNFRITGFYSELEAKELAQIAERHELPFVYDLGSGLLHPEAKRLLPEEPSVRDALNSKADLICFSGDKLLGGPQAGIIVGKKKYIERLKKNPYTRAFRIDKMVVSALEAVLRAYLDPERLKLELPIFAFLEKSLAELESRSDIFIDRLEAQGVEASLVSSEGEIGGGSAPGQAFPSCAIALDPAQIGRSAAEVEAELRQQDPPIVACIRKDCLLFDLRCVREDEEEELCRSILKIFAKNS
ncbi:MAG: L-seryl-tRNA(Sec) selenium transferase [Eubacteriales bacterium]|nr:L-seryl-tRNA(Sec) selenium transferase [Eubacteriales bacterium]